MNVRQCLLKSYLWDMTYRMLMCRDMLNPGNIHGTSKILSHLKGSLFATDCEGYKQESEYRGPRCRIRSALQNEVKLLSVSIQDFSGLLFRSFISWPLVSNSYGCCMLSHKYLQQHLFQMLTTLVVVVVHILKIFR